MKSQSLGGNASDEGEIQSLVSPLNLGSESSTRSRVSNVKNDAADPFELDKDIKAVLKVPDLAITSDVKPTQLASLATTNLESSYPVSDNGEISAAKAENSQPPRVEVSPKSSGEESERSGGLSVVSKLPRYFQELTQQ